MRTLEEIDKIMKLLPERIRTRWCKASMCGCLGCVNGSANYYYQINNVTPPTEEEWQMWMSAQLPNEEKQ